MQVRTLTRRTLGVTLKAAVFGLWAVPLLADAPAQSLRPELRPSAAQNTPSQTITGIIVDRVETLRPKLRPQSLRTAPAQAVVSEPVATATATLAPDAATNVDSLTPILRAPGQVSSIPTDAGSGLAKSLRPQHRPKGITRAAKVQNARLAAGSVCGSTALQGEVIGTVPGRLNGCGVRNAIRLKSVSGVRLSTAATVDCPTAKAIDTWVRRGVKPAVGSQGGGVTSLRVVASYACRTRNNQPGAKISEHGRGRAIDIAGVGLRDGSEISVLKDWGKGRKGRSLKKMWRAACGPFGTVLGPDADRFHRDHFHFDTARYRSGSYCR